MSTILLTWVIIGSALALLHAVFFANIDSHWASVFWGDPVVYLLIIFLWPIMVVVFLKTRLLNKAL